MKIRKEVNIMRREDMIKTIIGQCLAESIPNESVVILYNITNNIVKNLLELGLIAGQVHPEFRTCPKCVFFPESPHHKECDDCYNGSNFKAKGGVCEKCGNTTRLPHSVMSDFTKGYHSYQNIKDGVGNE